MTSAQAVSDFNTFKKDFKKLTGNCSHITAEKSGTNLDTELSILDQGPTTETS